MRSYAQTPAYQGVRVLELAQGVAAPYCSMMLAQNGAEVLKVEPVGAGDWARGIGRRVGDHSAESIAVNRGKRSIALNLKSEAGKAAALELAAKADVVIDNYRPGVLKRLGLDYETVRTANPTVIWASLTGFGEIGPSRDFPATDTVMQGYTGFMTLNRDGEGTPRRLNMLAIDTSTGLYLAQAVGAALFRRALHGEGAYIATSLLECALAFQESRIVSEQLVGEAVQPVGAPVGSFRTTDGYLSLNARRQVHFARLCEILGEPGWLEDPRFVDAPARVEHSAELNALVAPHIAKASTAEWQARFTKADILHAPVYDYAQLREDPQVQEIEAIGQTGVPGLGALPATRLPGLPPPSARSEALGTPPRVGEHTRAILAELGYAPEAIETMLAEGAAGEPG
jgi:crotonobetainyl-CoA:carnitine CoA-transferase CaiB-like acyl-CoA transferase